MIGQGQRSAANLRNSLRSASPGKQGKAKRQCEIRREHYICWLNTIVNFNKQDAVPSHKLLSWDTTRPGTES